LAHGMGHGIRRARQFDERSNSLAPRDFFRRVSPGPWRNRWPGFATAPSIRRNRKRHTASGWPAWFVCTLPPSAAPFSARIRPGA
jgi:hypothetical protein